MVLSLTLAGALISGAHAELEIVKAGDLCAGYDNAANDFKIYYGPCESAATIATTETTPYFTAETQDMALIKDDDSSYLTDASKVDVIDPHAGSSTAQADLTDPTGGGKFAYVLGLAEASADGLDATGLFGTAFYLVTEGTVTSDTNAFPTQVNGQGDYAEVCISEISNGVCGAARSWSQGDLKYTLFGHLTGTQTAEALANYKYLGVRQHVTLQRFDEETVTAYFNDGVDLTDMGGTDVKSFTLTFDGTHKVTHVFPNKYNVGNSADCEAAVEGLAACPTTADNSFTRDVKIKVSADGSAAGNGVFFDYLFALEPSTEGGSDGLIGNGKYFVYDPDVSSGVVSSADKTSGAASTVGSVALAALAAMFLLG